MTTIPETPSPVLTHEEAAQSILLQFRRLTESIPGFSYLSIKGRRRITAAASLPDAFLQAVSVACDANPRLATTSEITGAELRDTIDYSRHYLSVADELDILAAGLRGTVAVRRSEPGRRALRAYEIAKRMNLTTDSQSLIPHLADMQRTLKRGSRKTKRTQPEPPAAEPTPAGTHPGEVTKAT
jgi:hypothetical protein